MSSKYLLSIVLLSNGLLSQSPNSSGMSVSSFSDAEVRGEGDDGRKK